MSDNKQRKEDEAKKFSKVTTEKKRRARINSSLKELRNLLRDSGKLDEFQYSRMEKAEVLEAAVVYLREKRYHTRHMLNLRRHGYEACAESILRCLAMAYSIEDPVYQRVRKFLQNGWTTGLLSSQLMDSANEMSVFTANQEPRCTSVSSNQNMASTVAPSNSASIRPPNSTHPALPTANPIWRPW